MTLEYLKEKKEKYQEKADYFKRLGFDNLAADFTEVVVLIADVIKEFENDKD
jgi:hypothetical protein